MRSFVTAMFTAAICVAAPPAALAENEPSLKDLCKDGGHATLVAYEGPGLPVGSFGNQGECVSFVERGGTLARLDVNGQPILMEHVSF